MLVCIYKKEFKYVSSFSNAPKDKSSKNTDIPNNSCKNTRLGCTYLNPESHSNKTQESPKKNYRLLSYRPIHRI